ncbi:armadillo-type protein [Scleroderma citrinum]
MDNELIEEKQFASFERYDEFFSVQHALLAVDLASEPNDDDNGREIEWLRKLTLILGEYQEQAYLLDPYLESLVIPAAECLRTHARACTSDQAVKSSTSRVGRLANLLYNYIKCRGYKTITSFFPHEIVDVTTAIEFMRLSGGPSSETSQWHLRYVVLLWLSLVSRIPFDLEQFDEVGQRGRTASALESIAKEYLDKAGLEREGAAILLARFYMRKDTKERFRAFLRWSSSVMQSGDIFLSLAVLQVLCEVVKSGAPEETRAVANDLTEMLEVISNSEALMGNTLIRKYRTKLLSRVGLRMIPPRPTFSRLKMRALDNSRDEDASQDCDDNNDEIDIPEELEGILDALLKAVQDRDTIVRWSAAKGIGRLSERLPGEFSSQVLENVLHLFSIHTIAGASIYDLPSIAEATWHGACLTSAEMARRALVPPTLLPKLLDWLSQALYFDIRKGAHSIGSNVRDAAAYVIWALARAQDRSSFSPYAHKLARSLVSVSLFDRDVSIRRAASAAFQEHVGRMGLFAHGIDVLRKTDFYSVSIRRNAFLVAAPHVAERVDIISRSGPHEEYRSALLDHLISITLRHWDTAMRQLGAKTLRLVCEIDLDTLAPPCIQRLARLLSSVDMASVHGAVVALTEIADAYKQFDHKGDGTRREIFALINRTPESLVLAPRNEQLLSAVCSLIAASITREEVELQDRSCVPHWRKLVDHGLRHRSSGVQEAAAAALATVSSHTDSSSAVKRYVTILHFHTHTSLDLHPEVVRVLFDALDGGLDDYTTDERGDVGSWIRIACIEGLTSIIGDLFRVSASLPDFASFLPPHRYHHVVGRILRQGVERLDNVRQIAGESFIRILSLSPPSVDEPESWRVRGEALMRELFLLDSGESWSNGEWIFPKAVKLLEIPDYRNAILTGLVLSVSTRTHSTQRPASSSLAGYVRTLPVTSVGAQYSVLSLTGDLVEYAQTHLRSNSVVVPVLQTLNMLFEADDLTSLPEFETGAVCMENMIAIASDNVSRLKNVQRIQESMKIIVNLFTFTPVAKTCLPKIVDFLVHPYPRVRSGTAEYLYLVLQSRDLGWEATENAEEMLLETEWYDRTLEARQVDCGADPVLTRSSTDVAQVKEAAQALVNELASNMEC